MKLYTKDEFLADCKGSEAPLTLNEFQLTTNVGKLWDNTIVKKKDIRYTLNGGCKLKFTETVYEYYVKNFDYLATKYFDERLGVSRDWFIKLKKHDSTRFIRNFHFGAIYNTDVHNSISPVKLFGDMYRGNINTNLLAPCIYRYIHNTAYNTSVNSLIRRSCFGASVYKSTDYYNKIKELYPHADGDKIYIPVASWSVPALVLDKLPFNYMLIGDVMCDVLAKTKQLHNEMTTTHNLFDEPDVLETICRPTEDLLLDEPFMNKHGNSFDCVFFCPPYYDLEVYDSDDSNQSSERYATYQEWLDGYWRGTMEVIQKLLKVGGKMGFTIAQNITTNGVVYDISEDMRRIAAEYITYTTTKHVHLGGKGTMVGVMRKADGIVEDIHHFVKK